MLAGTEGAAAEEDPPTAVVRGVHTYPGRINPSTDRLTYHQPNASNIQDLESTLEDCTDTKLNHTQVIVPGYASDASQYRRLEASFRRRGIPAWTVPLSAPMWAPTFGGRSIRPVLDRLHATVLDVALQGRPLPPTSDAGGACVCVILSIIYGLCIHRRPRLRDHDPMTTPSVYTTFPTHACIHPTDDNGQPASPPTSNPAGQYSLGAFLREMADPSQGAVFPVAEGGGAAALGGLLAGGDGEDPPSTQAFGSEELRYRVALVGLGFGL